MACGTGNVRGRSHNLFIIFIINFNNKFLFITDATGRLKFRVLKIQRHYWTFMGFLIYFIISGFMAMFRISGTI